jgi:hypothetical protein
VLTRSQAPPRKRQTFEDAETLNGLLGILRAGGLITAADVMAQPGANMRLVEPHSAEIGCGGYLAVGWTKRIASRRENKQKEDGQIRLRAL